MIPDNKLQDPMKDQPKAYEGIDHNHTDNPTLIETKKCDRCKFDTAEQSLTDKMKAFSDTTKTKFKDANGVEKEATIKKLIVKRGKFDDCQGWVMLWS